MMEGPQSNPMTGTSAAPDQWKSVFYFKLLVLQTVIHNKDYSQCWFQPLNGTELQKQNEWLSVVDPNILKVIELRFFFTGG